MVLKGEAVLALWNGVEGTRAREYDAWHTREHVPERVALPGMLGARRYVKAHGPLPDYLTLYDLETIDVLHSAPYRALLDNPSPWSRAMRPSLRDFLRMPCRLVMSAGGGLGGVIAACVLTQGELNSVSLRSELATLPQKQGIVAVHLLARDHNIPDVPFRAGGPKPNFANAGAVLLESYDEAEFSISGVKAALHDTRLEHAERTLTTYRLAYAIDRASLERVIPIAPPAG